jgi:hypothetical protein
MSKSAARPRLGYISRSQPPRFWAISNGFKRFNRGFIAGSRSTAKPFQCGIEERRRAEAEVVARATIRSWEMSTSPPTGAAIPTISACCRSEETVWRPARILRRRSNSSTRRLASMASSRRLPDQKTKIKTPPRRGLPPVGCRSSRPRPSASGPSGTARRSTGRGGTPRTGRSRWRRVHAPPCTLLLDGHSSGIPALRSPVI